MIIYLLLPEPQLGTKRGRDTETTLKMLIEEIYAI